MKVTVKNLKKNKKYKLPWPFKRGLGGGRRRSSSSTMQDPM